MTDHPNVYCALAAAQAEFSSPKKGAINPAFRSKYADLASVVEAVAPALSAHGIAFFHHVVATESETWMRTVLHHGKSDTAIHCDVPLILGKRDMQGFKSATTYAKRIGLESVTGVAPEDDDGNAAAKFPRNETPRGKPIPDEAMETGDGVVGVRGSKGRPPSDAAERARKAADDLCAAFRDAKTTKGLEGVWSHHEGIIARLRESYPTEHGDVLAAYEVRAKQLAEDAAALMVTP